MINTINTTTDRIKLWRYLRNVVKPVEDRTEINRVIAGIMRTTIAVLDRKPVDHDRLTLDSQLSWYLFDREASRWGMPAWTKENRTLVRALELCATTLNRAAGTAVSLDADEFERLFSISYPLVTPAMAHRLGSDVNHALATADLIIAETEQRIAELESASA